MNEISSPSALSLAVAVLRVSTGEQVAGTSLPEQEAACRATAEREGFTVVAVFSDEGLSGTRFASRAGLQDALTRLAELRQSQPDAALRLYFAAVDRATRDASVIPNIRAALRPLRAELAYANIRIDNNAAGRMVETTLGGFAAFERELIRERTTRGKLAKARAGLQSARGYRPFGYDIVMKRDIYPGSPWTPEDVGRYFVREDEAKTIRHIFTEYGAGRLSLRKMAAWLSEQGILTPRGNEWSFASLHVILKSSIYKGEAFYGRDEHWSEEVGGEVKKRRVRRQAAEIVTIPCPAIVAPEVWDSVQARFAVNKQSMSGNPERRYLLSGLLRCPTCGKKLYGHRRWRDGLAYGCSNNAECFAHVEAGRIEAATLSAIGEFVARPEVVREALESFQRLTRRPVPSVDGGAIRARLGELERNATNAARAAISAMGDGRDPKPYETAAEELARKAQELRERLASIAEETGPVKASSVPASVVVEVLSRAQEILSDESLPAALRNRALSALVEKITPLRDGTEKIQRGRPRVRWGVEIALRPMSASDTVGWMLIRWTVSEGLTVIAGPGRGTP
jgi:DNA invertase Pin-like site-specific DNA recombinase